LAHLTLSDLVRGRGVYGELRAHLKESGHLRRATVDATALIRGSATLECLPKEWACLRLSALRGMLRALEVICFH